MTASLKRPLTQHPTLACQPDLPASARPGFPAQERSCLGLLARVQLYSSSRAIIQLCIAFAATLAPARALMAAACLIARICTTCAACQAQRSDCLQACALGVELTQVCHLRMAILTTFQSMHASSHALHNAMLSICRKGLMGT